ncbi:hypothetical protein QEV83_12445 [Methylocapsa sp. D3K7]|uniref:hypothetical protein n=1 Tax=Methylocapsa sp. D3K7 TaxID=3041435 RepID=UPI00244ECCD9|nr:hypothetical protein [Methylocapsa sp. D3K7]WGJ13503.1 hypothetical protein QEV83_12445 [Methylocapsa sp. D3K7]
MKTGQKIFIIPVILAALTAFGMEATALSARNPLPEARLGAMPETPAVFVPFDGAQLND